jgi:hypothetical protein
MAVTVSGQLPVVSDSGKRKCGFGTGFTVLIALALLALGARRLQR